MVFKSLEKLRSGLQAALKTGEEVAERLALAEVDAVIQTRLQGIVIPSLIIALMFAVAELTAIYVDDPETLRIAATSIVLAAGLYGVWALVTGFIELMPILAIWLSTRVSPHKLARLFLYQLILGRLRQAFTNAEGRQSAAGHLARYALKFSGGPSDWEGFAYRLADQIAPRMVRHALLRAVLVITPVLAGWAYYRFQIFPDIILAQTGLGMWGAFLYPFAAIIDLVAGTGLRQALLA